MMTGDERPGRAAVREMAANLTMLAIEGDPDGLRSIADKMGLIQRDFATKAPTQVVDALEGRVVDAAVAAAFAMGAMTAIEMVAQEACRLKGGVPTSEATGAFVGNALKVVQERGKPAGSGLRYEDDKVIVQTNLAGYDLVVTRRRSEDAGHPYSEFDTATTMVKDGRVIRHQGEAQFIAGHLAELAMRGVSN